MKDSKGNDVAIKDKVVTRGGNIGYVVSLHSDSARIRVQFLNGMIRKINAKDVTKVGQ